MSAEGLTDDELLRIYFTGFCSGFASCGKLAAPGFDAETAMETATAMTRVHVQDPAVRHEIATKMRAVLAGTYDGPDVVAMKVHY